MVNQGLTAQYHVMKGGWVLRLCFGLSPQKKIRKEILEMGNFDEELTQGPVGKDGKVSELYKIDSSTRELLEGLRSIESLAENINKRLLPPMEKPLAKENKVEQAPNGWLEEHLAHLRVAKNKIIKIIEKLDQLSWATKTDVK